MARYFIIFAAVWVVAMTWRIYPQFKDALKNEGRVMNFAAYVEERCGQRIGLEAKSCEEEERGNGRRLVALEQRKSILLIVAPLLAYLLVYLPLRLAARKLRLPTGRLLVALALALPASLAPAGPAAADANWKQSSSVWRQMDKCTRDARKQFPDYTAEANAKREAFRQKCLRASNLPGEVDPPQQAQPAPAQQ